MNSTFRNLSKILFTVLIACAMTACSGGVGSVPKDGTVGEQNLDTSAEMAKLEADLDEINTSMTQYQGKLDSLSVINLSSQGDGGKALAAQFKVIIDQILGTINRVQDRADALQAKLVAQLDKIDPNNPKYEELKQKVEDALAKLEEVKAYVVDAKDYLVSKIDQVVAKVDGLVENIDSAILKAAVGIVWQEVKTEVMAARNELAA